MSAPKCQGTATASNHAQSEKKDKPTTVSDKFMFLFHYLTLKNYLGTRWAKWRDSNSQ